MISYKGFNKDLTCRGFQYEDGKHYKHEGKLVRCKEGGFHSCEFPLDVFTYYSPSESIFYEVEVAGDIDRCEDDTKIASAEITIKAELSLPEFIQRGVDWIMSKTSDTEVNSSYKNKSLATNTGDQSAATNTGDWSAATNTGDQSAATNTGNKSAATNTGDQSAATNTGYWSAATNTGDQSAATNTGNKSAATNTGYQSAATNTGDWSAATNTGDQSAATNTGYQSAAEVGAGFSVAMASGYKSKARAGEGSVIFIVYRNDEFEIIHAKAAIAGKDVKADTWYSLNEHGEFVEA